ncbi:DUF6716 putative glycosyltransferase [Microbacterium aurantiacum]|uniref:DUF6716 putative glycosyltransferase n=1 Tax=Microbacterium aurantiacum TaxID=162393 RepID=UPI003D741AA2
MSGADAAPLRIVGLADTDSYVKWAAHLLGALGPAWSPVLTVVTTPLVVSDTQLTSALAGSGLAAPDVERRDLDAVAERLRADPPDVVLVAGRGPLVRLLASVVADIVPRPVIVTGLPGISIPATRKALLYRAQCDLFVVHSQRERRDFTALAREQGVPHRFALATLPFARGGVTERHTAVVGETAATAAGADLIFAAQAKVPALAADRRHVARLLVRAARARPDRRVVVKLRAKPGESQTHLEETDYRDLVAELGPMPENLVFSTAPMARALDSAGGLVTVSSTAAIEAIARGVGVIALDSFGVSAELINEVLADAGLLGSEADVEARRFRHPAPHWLAENYFHDPSADDWEEQTARLVRARRRGDLVPRPPVAGRGGTLRAAWDRKVVLGPLDTSAAGRLATVVGIPVRAVVRAARRVRNRAAARSDRQQPAARGSSAQERSTSAVRTSTTSTG